MNRQEAAIIIKAIGKHAIETHLTDPGDILDATVMAVKALVPKPDEVTGLVPCGCGGKARIWPSDPTQFTHVITDYEVGCTQCAMTTGWVRGKQENAVKVWNTAMGWKGGAE